MMLIDLLELVLFAIVAAAALWVVERVMGWV